MGVSVTETNPEIRIAAQMLTANSLNSRPRMPPINSTGMKTAASDRVMEMMVKPISLEPSNAACIGGDPISIWRTMFSSMTMASSTTNPTHRMRAIMDRLSRLKSRTYITANVPMMEKGSARLGIAVAERFRRNRKITMTTRPRVSSKVNCTSWKDSRMLIDRSYRMCISTEGGIWTLNIGSSCLMESVTSTVLVPGWRWIARIMERRPATSLL